jgi:hypothetical protein
MATVYEIIQGINQAAANAYDGSEAKVGLAREDGDPILDRRVMDGFKVRFIGPILRVSYQSEIRLQDVKDKGFEDSIISKLKDIIKFLKKEYKAITGNTLTLTIEGDHNILVQRMSNYRTDVQAQCDYKIGGIKDVDNVKAGSDKDRLDSAIKNWLELGPGKKRAPKVGWHNPSKGK